MLSRQRQGLCWRRDVLGSWWRHVLGRWCQLWCRGRHVDRGSCLGRQPLAIVAVVLVPAIMARTYHRRLTVRLPF